MTSFFRLVNESEVREAAKKPSNNKTPGPDEVNSEDLKTSDPKTVTKTLNEMLRERNGKHTNGYKVLLLKPGKDRTEPDSYRPVNLLSTYRKLISLINLKRINPKMEASILTSQYAYGNWKSTGDIVLAHKNLLAGPSTKRTLKVFAGIDMSKAFDTVDRKELIDILRKRHRGRKRHHHKTHTQSNNPESKNGKTIGKPFNTNSEVPQRDGLSPRIFTPYPDEALREIDRELTTEAPKGQDPRYTIMIMLKETRNRYPNIWSMHTT